MQETQEEKVIPCKECFHFKTVIVKPYNIRYFFFQDNKILNDRLKYYGQVEVWFCKKDKLPWKVYLNKQKAYAITSLTCNCGDYEDTTD